MAAIGQGGGGSLVGAIASFTLWVVTCDGIYITPEVLVKGNIKKIGILSYRNKNILSQYIIVCFVRFRSIDWSFAVKK